MKKLLNILFLLFTITALISAASVNILTDKNFGNILTDQNGKTLYFFSNDAVPDSSACLGKCLENWPVFYSENLTLDNSLNKNDFGTITHKDGTKQNTYKGWPLYYYKNDIKKGDISGDKVGNLWFVAKPDYSIMLVNNNLKGMDNNFYDKNNKKITAPSDSSKVTYLTDSHGVTLYIFVKDEKNKNNYSKPDNKNDVWPVYETGANIIVPSILNKKDFTIITVSNGKKQITYKGHPLYFFANDNYEKGNTKGVSVPSPGVWPVADKDLPELQK